ncbi:MAG: hypothetical protein VYC64_06145 [Candidatus Latescibacterota bacterium]|nr:hypothetical protein [Candidatus Latescibacterota bacterium]
MTEDAKEPTIPTTRLALILGTLILVMLGLLSYLAPLGTPVSAQELHRLLNEDRIGSIDVGVTAIVGHLTEPQLVTQLDGGRPAQVQAVRVFRSLVLDEQLDSLQQSGLDIRENSRTTDGALGPYTWAAVVGFLLIAGGWHLVDQAARHRRYGSPRQRIADLEKQLEQGKIDPDRFRREVEQLSTEL